MWLDIIYELGIPTSGVLPLLGYLMVVCNNYYYNYYSATCVTRLIHYNANVSFLQLGLTKFIQK